METALDATNTDVLEHVESEIVEPEKLKKPKKFVPIHNPRNKKVKARDAKIIELSIKGATEHEIAKICSVSQSTVSRKVQEFAKVFKRLDRVNDYRDLKSDLLSAAELVALESALDPKNLDNTSMLNGAKAFDIFNKANRLHNGLSTDNQAHQVLGKISVSLSTPLKTEEKK